MYKLFFILVCIFYISCNNISDKLGVDHFICEVDSFNNNRLDKDDFNEHGIIIDSAQKKGYRIYLFYNQHLTGDTSVCTCGDTLGGDTLLTRVNRYLLKIHFQLKKISTL